MKFLNYLTEKLIIIGNGAKYGQVVFLAGGGGSGKSFAAKNFMESEKFKVRNVDEYKEAFLELNRIKKSYPELDGLSMKNPKDVSTLHSFVKARNIKQRTLDLLLSDVRQSVLPNIMFDMVSDDPNDIKQTSEELIEVGYDPKNIHIVWVLTNYSVAVHNNKTRDRVLFDEILLKAHTGVANTVTNLLRGKSPVSRSIADGGIYIILNNRENTIYMTTLDTPETLKNQQQEGGEKTVVIKDFKYLKVKDIGKPVVGDEDIKKQLADWITTNIPKTRGTWNIRRRKHVT